VSDARADGTANSSDTNVDVEDVAGGVGCGPEPALNRSNSLANARAAACSLVN
jgi:hypothetical protein